MKDISTGKLILIMFGFLLTSFFGTMIANAYSKGQMEEKVDQIERRLEKIPSNAVLLQFMDITEKGFGAVNSKMDSHIEDDKIKWSEQQKLNAEIRQDIKDFYLSDYYRSTKKKRIDYTSLQSFLWENGRGDLLYNIKKRT